MGASVTPARASGQAGAHAGGSSSNTAATVTRAPTPRSASRAPSPGSAPVGVLLKAPKRQTTPGTTTASLRRVQPLMDAFVQQQQQARDELARQRHEEVLRHEREVLQERCRQARRDRKDRMRAAVQAQNQHFQQMYATAEASRTQANTSLLSSANLSAAMVTGMVCANNPGLDMTETLKSSAKIMMQQVQPMLEQPKPMPPLIEISSSSSSDEEEPFQKRLRGGLGQCGRSLVFTDTTFFIYILWRLSSFSSGCRHVWLKLSCPRLAGTAM